MNTASRANAPAVALLPLAFIGFISPGLPDGLPGVGWRRGYVIVGTAQLALALCFAVTRRWWPSGRATRIAAAVSRGKF